MGLIVNNKKIMPRGFTLLEIVIAMAIFSIVMVMVMGALNTVLRAQEQVSSKAKRLGEIQMATAILVRDLSQIVNRPVVNYSGEKRDSVVVDSVSEIRLEFTKGGIINPNAYQTRSSLQRVGYGLEQATLMRYTWPVLDRVSSTAMARRHLLGGVQGFDLQYMNAKGEFIETFAGAIALLVDIDFGNEGHFRRVFALHGEVVNAPQS